jgi:TonB family protein
MKSLLDVLAITAIVLGIGTACAPNPIRQADEFDKAVVAYLDLSDAGNWQESLIYVKRAYELNKNLRVKNHEITAKLSWDYAKRLELTGGDLELAAQLYSDALTINESLFGEGSPILVSALLGLGRTSQKAGEYSLSKQYYERALMLAERHHGLNSSEFAKFIMDNIDDPMVRVLDPEQTGRYLDISYDTLKKELDGKDRYNALAAFHKGQYQMATGNHKYAESFLLEALEIFKHLDPPDHRLEVITHTILINTYERTGESKAADQHALAISRIIPVSGNQQSFAVYRGMPEYPASALREGKDGQVTVEFTVNTNGMIENPKIAASTDAVFNQASLEAAKKFRYAPKFVDGKPVSVSGIKNTVIYKNGKVIYPAQQ